MPYPYLEPPQLEDIYHIPTGLRISFEGAMDMISAARLVCVGETHDSIHDHRVQFQIIRELYRRFPGQVAIGMEMFREPQQDALDRWTRGELTELEFLKESAWYRNWGRDFGYYREIMTFARDNRIDVIALNPSKELQQEVRKTGLENLPDDISEKLPEMGEIDPFQRAMLEGVFGGHIPTGRPLDAFVRVQLLWEESMAQRVVDYLSGERGKGKKMVTLTGGWHVRYGFGLPKKVLRRMPLPYVIVLPDPVEQEQGPKQVTMDIELPEIPLLPGDFLWKVPYETITGKAERLGLRLSGKEGKVLVREVLEDSTARKAGIDAGDLLMSLDNVQMEHRGDVLLHLETKEPGDTVSVTLVREGVEEPIQVNLVME